MPTRRKKEKRGYTWNIVSEKIPDFQVKSGTMQEEEVRGNQKDGAAGNGGGERSWWGMLRKSSWGVKSSLFLLPWKMGNLVGGT